jgi:hypothetical protein
MRLIFLCPFLVYFDLAISFTGFFSIQGNNRSDRKGVPTCILIRMHRGVYYLPPRMELHA